VIEIKNALQANPELGEARFLLGTTLLQEGNPVAAEVELRKALALKYPDELVLPELARALLALGQAKKLVDEFGNAQFASPAATARFQTPLSAAYELLKKPELAQAALAAALAADPNYGPALLSNAWQTARAKDFEGALAITEKVITRDAADADAWKLKGDVLLYGMNKRDEALVAYRKSVEVKPSYAAGQVAVLTLLLQQGDVEEAGKQLGQLKRIAPNSPMTKYFEAQLAYQKKDFKGASDLARQLVQLVPNNPRFLQLAGASELQLNQLAQAEIYLANATRVAPELLLARRLLVVAYLRSGQSAKALEALNALSGKDGLDPALYSLAGEVHLQNGDAKKAEDFFARAIKLDPDNARKRTALAVTHLAGGQTSTAIDELQGIASSDKGTTADLALISAHLRRSEFDKALAAIDRLEAKQPDKPLAANLRGRVQLAQKDPAAARKSFERALTLDPAYFAAAASLAALDMADKKPDDAKKRFENLLAKNPKNGQALLALAQLAVANGAGKDEVAGLLTKAIDANPTEATPRLLLIDLMLWRKDTKQALAAAQGGVAALPNNAELLNALGRVQQMSGDVNQAMATYSKLIALQPLSPLPHIRMAEAQVASKNTKAAEQSLRKALEIKPDSLEAQRGLIILAIEAKRFPDAVKTARTVQEQRPNSSVGFAMAGDIGVAQKNWDVAAASYRSGLQRAAGADLAIKLHSVLVASGKVGESDRFATTWLNDRPNDAAFLGYLGERAIARKDYEAAEKIYLSLVQTHPGSAVGLNNLAWVSSQLKRDSAVGYAEKANQLAPNQPAFMDTLAMLLADRGEFTKAIELQQRALAAQPSSAGLRLNLAKIYVKAGDKGPARAELEALAKLGEKFPGQVEVSAMLKNL
jgi:putative PEP-CTERM system TPR-repeat lipoprotein